MSTMKAAAPALGAAVRGAVVIVDDCPSTAMDVTNRIKSQFGGSCEVYCANGSDEAVRLLESLQGKRELNVSVVAINLKLEVDIASGARNHAIEMIRQKVPPATQFIAYYGTPLEDPADELCADIGFACIRTSDVEAAVHGVFLENELRSLDSTAPFAAQVMHTINVGISIQNPQMDVVWTNRRNADRVGPQNQDERKCWRRFHNFRNRKFRCGGCTGCATLAQARRQMRKGQLVNNGVKTGYHLLPVQETIERVEVNAAPLTSSDGRKVLAVIEASRFVTREWKDKPRPQDRLYEVLAAARKLGRHDRKSRTFSTVAVYYRPDAHEVLHLFDAASKDCNSVPRVLRLAEAADAYSDALEGRAARMFQESGTAPPVWHFIYAGITPQQGKYVVIDVTWTGVKPEGLLRDDLRPYWEYVVENFESAWKGREEAFRGITDSILQEFLAGRGKGIRDEGGLDRALQAAADCVQRAVQPLSMYVRVLDRTSGNLVKRNGVGFYYEMAPERRELNYDGIGSGRVASRQQGYWEDHADVREIRKYIGRDLSHAEETEIERISGYVTLPLVWMGRVHGTLSVQFSDDSLFSPMRRRFVEAMANALSSTLGSWAWAQERGSVAQCSNDLDRMMFLRSEHREEEEINLLSQVTRMVFELTRAEVVAYYRYDAQSHRLTLVRGATHGALPPDAALPETVPPHVGIVSLAANSRRGYRADDYRGTECLGIRSALLAAYPHGPENAFCRWLGCEIAEPVIGCGAVQGVLVALSSIPRWLSKDDAEVLQEFAFKTGLSLEAKHLMRQLNWHLSTQISLNHITAAMARTPDVGILYRLFLLAATTNECLGFSRAILFLRQEREADKLVAAEAVGVQSRLVAQARWREAQEMLLKEKMDACIKLPETRPGDLLALVPELVLDLARHPAILQALKDRTMVVRRHGQPHPICDPQIVALLTPESHQDGEYVFAPLVTGGEWIGGVLADRAFLAPTEIPANRLDLLELLTGEFGLMLEALRLRHEEEETRVATAVARGVSYSLRTRAAALEGRLSNLAHALGNAHGDAIAGMRRAVKFFGRAGTLASKILRMDEVRVSASERADLATVLRELVDALADPRIACVLPDVALWVQVERHHLEDLFLEVLWNACQFTDQNSGRITLTLRAERDMAVVNCEDNGPGIHPDFRRNMFKPFKCYPTTGMGLGLSYVSRLLQAYRGSIEEVGAWQQGAHFIIRIPLVEEATS